MIYILSVRRASLSRGITKVKNALFSSFGFTPILCTIIETYHLIYKRFFRRRYLQCSTSNNRILNGSNFGYSYFIKEAFHGLKMRIIARSSTRCTISCREVDISNITGTKSGLEANGGADATEFPFCHDGNTIAQYVSLLHRMGRQNNRSPFLCILYYVPYMPPCYWIHTCCLQI